jgi:N-formylglutamate amidohydrolase
MSENRAENDSQPQTGGRIPGYPGIAAFRVWEGEPSAIPVMIAVPHAGRAYPRTLLRAMRQPESAALKLEDRHVDLLAREIARQTGAALLVAQAPRAMIDLNRAPEDVDWEMFERSARRDQAAGQASRRVRSGLGLIPRRLPGVGELWRRHHDEQELVARLRDIHEPYHAKLGAMLQALHDRWGAALLVDLHSMPPLPASPGHKAAEFVIGDRFGTTCHGSLVGAAFSHLSEADRPAAHNRPYAGGYVLERHARPGKGVHAMQIEIDRASYLDSRLAEPGAGFDSVTGVLSGMIRRLAAGVVELSSSSGESVWSMAAE